MTGNISKKQVAENDAFVNCAAIIYEGKLNGYIEDMSFLGLFYSQKNVEFKGTALRSIKSPKVNVKGNLAEIEIFACSAGNVEAKSLAHMAEKLLEQYEANGTDLANIMYFARKNFVFYEDYQKFSNNVKNIKYSVKINLERDED